MPDQHVGPEAGGLARVLALPAQQRGEDGGHQQADQEVELGVHRGPWQETSIS